MSTFQSDEITKMVNLMIGRTDPAGDSAIDHEREENLKKLIDLVNWCLDGVYDSARHRKSFEGSVRDIGERAYSSLLEWKQWLSDIEEELK